MDDSSKLKRFIQLKVFGGRVVENEDAVNRELDALEERDLSRPDGQRRQSTYVKVFEEMVDTVYKSQEVHLLTENEWVPFSAYQNLPYNSRYCLVRLLLLTPNHWYSLSSFERWKREVGREGIIPSMMPLCRPVKEFIFPEVKDEEPTNVIDLTFTDEEDVKPCIEAGPSKPLDPFQRVIQSNPNDINLKHFCQDEGAMTIEELLNRMTVEQLKSLAKQNKCPPAVQRPKKLDYVASLLKNATTQSVLGFASKPSVKPKGKTDTLRQTQLPFAPKKKESVQQYLALPAKNSQQDRLRKQVLAILGKCYRLNYDFFKLVRRMHIIAYRCTEHPTKLMIPALLASFKKRTYPTYTPQRDPDIWPSRHHLLDYEKALELEALVDDFLEAETSPRTRGATTDHHFVTPATSVSARTLLTTPLRTPGAPDIASPHSIKRIRGLKEEVDDEFPLEDEESIAPLLDTPQVQKAKMIVQWLDKWLLHSWKFHLELKHKNSSRPPSLQRFESGFIYTRLLRRSLQSLATMKDYPRELGVIETLLSQREWQRGKRAKLYERRAIIQMTHLCRAENTLGREHVLRQALEGVRQALQDDDTHLVARPGLLRRLQRLEKRLNVPQEERAQCEGELRKADEVVITAKRIHQRASSLKLDISGNIIKDRENASVNQAVDLFSPRTATPLKHDEEEVLPAMTSWRKRGKTVWEGQNHTEVNVEERALQYYVDMGFRGFHAETSIMTTIWTLLNWDIIYADIRGAFETRYQSAPLDIVDDSFYRSRKDLFDNRFEEIRGGKAAEIITRHDTMYRPKNTWAIGVRWDICGVQDLIEIVECLKGPSLATICKLFCEDYVGRSSGAPDLIIWNHEERICKFVEVKGPGDSAQENQKLWFDSLLGAGIHVEVCRVVDVSDVNIQASTRKGKSKNPATSTIRKRKRKTTLSGEGSNTEAESGDERDYDKLDHKSEDELPQATGTKRRRITDPGTASPGIQR